MITTLLTALFFIIAPSPNATAPTAVTAVTAPVTTATPDPIPDGIRPLCIHSVEPLCI